jgi:hypothetical protein
LRLDALLAKILASSTNMIGRRSTYTRKGKKVMFPLQQLLQISIDLMFALYLHCCCGCCRSS